MPVLRLQNVVFEFVGQRPHQVKVVSALDARGAEEIKSLITQALQIAVQSEKERPPAYWRPDTVLYTGISPDNVHLVQGMTFHDYVNRGQPLELNRSV